MVHFNDVIRSFYRMFIMVLDSKNILIIFLFAITFFSITSRIFFDGLEIGSG